MRFKFFTALFFLLGNVLFAQHQHVHSLYGHNHQGEIPCFTDEMHLMYMDNDPQYKRGFEEAAHLIAEELERTSSSNGTYGTENNPFIIPVVVHVMWHSEEDNISEAQIVDAIRVLNEDFRRMNANATNTRAIFRNVAADMNIEFRLAKIDPNGNCTNGITRTRTPLSINAGNSVKQLIAWDNRRYLNIWTVRSINSTSVQGTILGYATFPNPNNTPTTDGIVMRHDRMGSIGTSNVLGRTLTHEAGHILALFHPFQGGCFNGDQCGDTPPVAAANFSCNLSANSCVNDNPDLPDQVENYMDYANDACMNMFTVCQRSRAHAVLNVGNLRGSLVTAANLIATGVEQPSITCEPTIDFTYNTDDICTGQAVQFTNRSAILPGMGYQWTFPGGTPSSSTDPNPLVVYNTPGHYPVYLELTGTSAPVKKDIQKAIAVRVDYPEIKGPFFEGFENTSIPFPWHSNSRGGWAWEITDRAAATGNKSAFIDNFDIRSTNVSTSLISPGIDMRWTRNLTLRYKVAFARTATGPNTDQLRVAVSTDCGATWQTRSVRAGFLLSTMPTPITGPFTPTQSDHWREETLNLDDLANNPEHILIRFELVSGGGNNLYLDDIQIDAVLSNQAAIMATADWRVYPNPGKGQLNISFYQPEAADARIWITDLTGRQMGPIIQKQVLSGRHDVAIDMQQYLSSGMYILHFENGSGVITEKITIQ
jgi:PKD repeat protein